MTIQFSRTALSRARKARGWTPERLAAECWVRHRKQIVGGTIRNYERGSTAPNIERASLLAEALGVEIGELCEEKA